jgi:hypothetical protein
MTMLIPATLLVQGGGGRAFLGPLTFKSLLFVAAATGIQRVFCGLHFGNVSLLANDSVHPSHRCVQPEPVTRPEPRQLRPLTRSLARSRAGGA